MATSDIIVVFVTVTIPKDKEEEFLGVMAEDVKGSRQEAGCLRFDLIKGAEAEGGTQYHFYEAYKDSAAMAFHKEQAHYKLWADFKAANMETVGASQVCAAAPTPETVRVCNPVCCAELETTRCVAMRRVSSRAMVHTSSERRAPGFDAHGIEPRFVVDET